MTLLHLVEAAPIIATGALAWAVVATVLGLWIGAVVQMRDREIPRDNEETPQ